MTLNVLTLWRELGLDFGSLDDDSIRINVGSLVVGEGKVRNKIPDKLIAYGEIRSLLDEAKTKIFINDFKKNITEKVGTSKGSCNLNVNKLADAYFVDMSSNLLKKYQGVLHNRGVQIKSYPTYIGSDCQVFRTKGIECFTLSTGVDNEHTANEEFSIKYAEQIIDDLVNLVKL